MNWFLVAVAVLELGGACWYWYEGKTDHGWVWFFYAVATAFLVKLGMK